MEMGIIQRLSIPFCVTIYAVMPTANISVCNQPMWEDKKVKQVFTRIMQYRLTAFFNYCLFHEKCKKELNIRVLKQPIFKDI